MGKVRVITFDAFGETWSSVAAFAKEHANGDRARYERIRSRIYKGMCTAEQAVELERYHGSHRWKRMAEIKVENEKKGIVCESTRKGPPKPKPFAPYDKHEDKLCMRLVLLEKTPFRDSTVYEVAYYCCGLTALMTHAQLLRREHAGFRFCYSCARTGGSRKKAAARIAALQDMDDEERDAFLAGTVEEDDIGEETIHPTIPDFPPPPPSVLADARGADVWEDRMYLRWGRT